jgi:type IV pilus assembly protein PilE
MISPAHRSPQHGFSLIEIMVTIGIVGLLTAIAMPSYNAYVLKAHRVDAVRSLTAFRQAFERCYSQNFTYLNAGTTPCPAAPGTATTSTNGYYDISFPTLTQSQYVIWAVATNNQVNDSQCQTFVVTNAGQQTATNGANDTGADTTQACWGGK